MCKKPLGTAQFVKRDGGQFCVDCDDASNAKVRKHHTQVHRGSIGTITCAETLPNSTVCDIRISRSVSSTTPLIGPQSSNPQ